MGRVVAWFEAERRDLARILSARGHRGRVVLWCATRPFAAAFWSGWAAAVAGLFLMDLMGLGGPPSDDPHARDDYNHYRARRSLTASFVLHLSFVMLTSVSFVYGCRHRMPLGLPGGKGENLPKGEVKAIQVPKRVRRVKKVRVSPIKIHQVMEDIDQQEDQRQASVAGAVGVPGGIGKGEAAPGSPHGTVLGGKLYFYRIKFDGPNWDANSDGVRPLMQEVLKAGTVREVSGFNNAVSFKDLPKHSGEYMPCLIYMTGTGAIQAGDQEVKNLRDYLNAGGMLFVDVSGGDFHEHFVQFMRRVFPDKNLTPIEFDHEIYRGGVMPYAMLGGFPVYRRHSGAGPALGIWVGNRVSVFYSRGDLGAGWAAAGIFKARRRNVEQAFRMGVNIVAYSLLYYKTTG